MSGGWRAVVTALVVVLPLAAACEDEPARSEPTAAVPPASSDAPSATADPEPTLGPVATVRAWVDAYNATLKSGDATSAFQLSTTGCRECEWELEPLEKVHARGGYFKGGRWRILNAEVTSENDNRTVVSAAVEVAAGRTLPRQGAEPVNYESEKLVVDMTIVPSPGGWLVDRIVHLP